jgi:phosphoglucosamine mutase
MSNLGLERFLDTQGLRLHRTNVGDRYVAEKMRSAGLNVGGEQSGHMILSDFATTGDGLVAALQVLATIVEQGRPASEVCRVFTPLPQMLRSVRFNGPTPLKDPMVQDAIAAAEAELGVAGRLLIRESGTEPVVRVMAEAENEAQVAAIVTSLCEIIARVARQGAGAPA